MSSDSTVSVMFLVLMLVMCIAMIVAQWRIFEKAGIDGWKAIIPFYNTYCWFGLVWTSGWFFLLTLIPIVGIIAILITSFKLGAAFGKGLLFNLGLIFFSPVFYLILAFDSSEYDV